jgi:phosphate transport system protein
MTMGKHINAEFDAELGSLKGQIMTMGNLVDRQVGEAVAAMIERDLKRAERVVEGDRAVDQLELAIDEQCVRILALQQPEASDLRFVAAALKMVTDLERIGDLAVNMAERVPVLSEGPTLKAAEDLPEMAAAAQRMLRDVLDAFVNNDSEKAEKIRADDSAIDVWMVRILGEVQDVMSRDPSSIARGLGTILFAKHIERLADHVTNVAEMIIYLVRGRDVRHT